MTGPPIELLPATKAFAAATFGPAFLQQREASGIALAAGVHFPQFTATLHLSKGAAMPPGQVTGLTFVESGYTDVTIRYDQPDVGTGIFLHYEYRVDSEPWVSTMSADTLYTITGLLSGTLYSIRVRGVSNVGRGPASMPIEARTQPVVPPTLPLRFRLQVPGGGLMEQTWETPANNGGSPITHYEVQVIDPDGDAFPAGQHRHAYATPPHARPAALSALRFPCAWCQRGWRRAVHVHSVRHTQHWRCCRGTGWPAYAAPGP